METNPYPEELLIETTVMVYFVLLPNKKPNESLPADQLRFWNAQWLGRLKDAQTVECHKGLIGIPFDQPEVPYTAIYLLGILREIIQVEVNIIDLWQPGVQICDTEPLVSILTQGSRHVFLFSPFTNNYSFAIQCVKFIKSISPSSICIGGGPHVSYCPKECIVDGFDYIICGMGEKALLHLASSRWRHKQRIIFGGKGSEKERLCWRQILPAYDLLPEKYSRTFYARLFTTHGCPFSCVFCSNTVWHRKYPFFMPVERVEAELRLIQDRVQFQEIYVNDENFTLKQDHYEPISQLLMHAGIPWGCETRIDTINKRILKYLSEMGCQEIDFGIESLDAGVLQVVNKNIDLDDAYRVLYDTVEFGIRSHVNLMVGLPGETVESAFTTLETACEWIRKGIISTVDYFVTVPYPGTQLYNDCDKYDLSIRTRDWDQYREDSIPVYDYPGMAAEQIYHCWRSGLKMFSETIESVWS